MNYEHIEKLIEEITCYLANGGLFNPELMEHDKVRDLLVENRTTMRQMLEVVRAGKHVTGGAMPLDDPDPNWCQVRRDDAQLLEEALNNLEASDEG